MFERWYRLAERYVSAVERATEATDRIADAQSRSGDIHARNVDIQAKNVEENARFAEAWQEVLDKCDMSKVSGNLARLSEVLADLREWPALRPTPSEGSE